MLTSVSTWGLDYAPPRSRRKARDMRPAAHAGSRVGTLGYANRSGGKRRGVKGHDSRKGGKVNVSKLNK